MNRMKAFTFSGFLAFILVLSACSSESGGNSGDSEASEDNVTITIGSWLT